MARTCGDAGGLKEDGDPCGVTANLGADGQCIWHSPARKEEARAARSQGGRTSAERKRREPVQAPPAPRTIAEARDYASWAVEAVASGKLDARTGDVVQKILKEFRTATEKADVESEVKALRAEIRKRGTDGG